MTKEEFLKRAEELCSNYGLGHTYIAALEKRTEFMNFLENEGFLTAPASTKYHGVYEGGLVDHSFNVCNRLLWLTRKLDLQWQRPASPFIVGLFHDICKHDQYIKAEGENRWIYNPNTKLKGHGEKSVIILSKYFVLTEEERLCIRYHMGAYEKEDWAGFDQAIREYNTVLFTHTADMMASKVDET